MIIRIGLVMIFAMIAGSITAQKANIDSLKNDFWKATDDSARYHVCHEIYGYYEEVDKDSALYYADKLITLAKKNNHPLAESMGLIWKGYQSTGKGKYAVAHQCFIEGIRMAEDNLHTTERWRTMNFAVGKPGKAGKAILAVAHQMFGFLMGLTQNYKEEILHLDKARKLATENGDSSRVGTIEMVFARRAIRNNQLDSALIFLNHAEKLKIAAGDKSMLPNISGFKGNVFFLKGNYPEASQYYFKGVKQANEGNNLTALARNYFGITQLYLKMSRTDSSLYYARESARVVKALATFQPALDPGIAYENLYLSFKQRNQQDSAFFYQGLALRTKDTLYNDRINTLVEFQSLSFQEQLRLRELEKEKESYQARIRTYVLVSVLLTFIVIAIFLYRTNKLKQKANTILGATLSDLKATQSQLIQSEKMASLGELTAGIAHEIQNPLNFVNNFSEVNAELIEELKSEKAKAKSERDEYLEDELLNDIAENEKKINHHGRRAGEIVKGMLQHSQSSSGVKEPTNINALADEYLRLAYHGLRAKDKSFNAILKTDFDETIGNISIIPQDIGRVIVNLINNAFYAVTEKKKQAGGDYEPTVSVSTKKLRSGVEIRVRDNGMGIPPKIADKIFQPFFTTKPTGQGTGLGLSLSYDIVKAHGGNLTVNNKDGKGAELIIHLPI